MSEVSILVVDDALMMRNMISGSLQAMGYKNIDQAENGQIAIDKIKSKMETNNSIYNAIFLDWNMPILTGLEVVKFIRNEKSLNKVWIVMVTAESEAKNKDEAMKFGVDYFVTKPFDRNKISAIAQALFTNPRNK